MSLWLAGALVLGTILACEIALRSGLGGIMDTLTGAARRTVRVVGSEAISDIWKEKVLPAYARRIFVASLRLFGVLLLIAAPVLALAGLAEGGLAAGAAALMRPAALAAMIAVGMLHLFLRRRLA